jgi:phosphopantothenoylcysteine decarboxylase/phosphopantothenate--cysteine ligase
MVSILITAGPTREHLDDVRFLSNGSSGRMGCALAAAALAAGHTVTLVLGPVEIEPPAGATVRSVVSAREMQAAAESAFSTADIAIAAAAVADWRPAERLAGKPARAPGATTLQLLPNPDIVAGLAAKKGRRVVFGFGLESASAGLPAAIARGRRKLVHKQLDGIVVNLDSAIGRDAAEFVLCLEDGRDEPLPDDKAGAAARIVAVAVDLWRGRQAS